MTLRIVGAGLGRTGTTSLKAALEQLLDGRCYHMMEVFGRLDDTEVWSRAANDDAARLGHVPRRIRRDCRLARVRVLARAHRRVSRRTRVALDP